ncbi:hypothetical protein AAC387_Pa05g1030 [Persea americana]
MQAAEHGVGLAIGPSSIWPLGMCIEAIVCGGGMAAEVKKAGAYLLVAVAAPRKDRWQRRGRKMLENRWEKNPAGR